jgi:cytochrome-b5 reductase
LDFFAIPEIVVESPVTQRRGPPEIMAAPRVPTERKKVAVTHGHSMANWMMKIKAEPKVPPSNRIIGLAELRQHNTREDCWMAIRGKVFNVTDYIPYHPGGVPFIMKGAGQDATKMFNQIHSYVNFESMLINRQVGLYIPSEAGLPGEHPAKGGAGGSLCCCTACKDAESNDENLPETSFEQDETTVEYKVECNNPDMDANCWSMGIVNKQNLMVKLVTRPPEIWLANYKLHEKLANDQIKFAFENQFKKLILTLEKPAKTKWKTLGTALKPHNKCMHSSEAPKDFYPATLIFKERLGPGHYLIAVNVGLEVHIGIPVGWHVRIKIKDQDKAYTPVKFITAKQTSTYDEIEARCRGQVLYFLVKIFPNGKLTPLLDKVPLETPGALEIGALAGNFDPGFLQDTDRLILIAGGTGIAPFTGILKYIKDKRRDIKLKQVVLALSAKTGDDILWNDAWEKLVNFGWLYYFPYVTQGGVASDWGGNRGRVSPESIQANLEEVPEPSDANSPMYVRGMACGPTGFTDTAQTIFASLGLKDEDLFIFEG